MILTPFSLEQIVSFSLMELETLQAEITLRVVKVNQLKKTQPLDLNIHSEITRISTEIEVLGTIYEMKKERYDKW